MALWGDDVEVEGALAIGLDNLGEWFIGLQGFFVLVGQ